MNYGKKKKPRKKTMGGPAKKSSVPTMTYGGAQKFIMKEMGGKSSKPTALLGALKKKYPEEFGYGGGVKKPTMKKGGKTARKRKK